MAANCPYLESLFINSYDRKNIQDQDIQFIFENCKNLQKVSLEGLEGLTYKCMERITDCLPKLRYLNLTSNLVTYVIYANSKLWAKIPKKKIGAATYRTWEIRVPGN